MMRARSGQHAFLVVIAALAMTGAQSALPAWRTEREVLVTAGEGGASLAWPVTVAVSPKGVIAATQPVDGWIRLFAADGRPIGTIGGLERTPFDAMRLTRIGFTAETLWIADALKNRFTLFGPDMRLTRIIEAPPIPLGEAGLAGAAAAEALLSGRQVLLTSRPAQLGVGAVPETRLHWAIPPGQSFTPAPPLNAYMSPFRVDRGNSVVSMPNPFAPIDRFDVSTDGAFVATVHEPRAAGDSVEVRLFSDGFERYRRRLAIAPRPVTQDLIDAEALWIASTVRSRAGDIVSPKGYLGKLAMEANLPAVHRIVVGNDGTVWLRLTHRHEAERWMVLGPNGSPRATVTLPMRLDRDVHDVAPDRIWATERTADGLPQIVAYRVIQPD